jgi:hypothetical protein
MSVTHVGAGTHLARSGVHRTAEHPQGHGPSGKFSAFTVGQRLEVTVLRPQGANSYLVLLAGEQHLMESSVALASGIRVSALVVAVGEQLALRYLGSDSRQGTADDAPDASEPSLSGLLQALASRYKVTLDNPDRDLLQRAVRRAADPTAMALGGLFLAKIGAEVDRPSLDALYEAQTQAPPSATPAGSARSVNPPVDLERVSMSELSELLSSALPTQVDDASAAQGEGLGAHSGGEEPSRSAQSLLNRQDDGAVIYRYGSLPVLVSGRLMELELALFQQREPREGEARLRRLVMTLDTETLGPLQIEARSLNERLVIRFTGRSAQAAAHLAPYGRDVEQLAARLGWAVDGVEYEYASGSARAATQIIRHVLNSETIDSVL